MSLSPKQALAIPLSTPILTNLLTNANHRLVEHTCERDALGRASYKPSFLLNLLLSTNYLLLSLDIIGPASKTIALHDAGKFNTLR